MPLDTPMKAIAAHAGDENCGGCTRKPSSVAGSASAATEASIAIVPTASAG